MASLVQASVVATGQVQSLDSVRAHALPSDALIFTSPTKVQPANQNPGSYNLVESANALTLTTTGSVPIVTQSPFADLYKEGSLYFNGTTGNYVSATATGLAGTQWNTTGLTIEAWVNYQTFTGAASQSASSNQPNLLGFGGFSWQFGSNISGNSTFYYWTNGTTPVTYMATTSLSTNTWNHITFTCTSSGTGYMFVNGVQSQILTNTNGTISGPASTVSITGTPVLSGSTLYLNQNIGGTAGVSGYVADVRVITGSALYTSTFTVPSAPLSTSASGVTQALIRAGQNSPTVQNGALTFDRGLRQYMNFGPQTFNIVTQGFTAIWRGAFTGTAGSYESIWMMGIPGVTNGAISINRVGVTQQFYLTMYPSNSTTAIGTLYTSGTLSQATNYVIAVRYNPVTQVTDIWINGIFNTSSTTFTNSNLIADRLIPITYVGYAPVASSFTSMTANCLAVYNRALSNVEIYNSYLALTTSTVNAPIEIGDANGTPAMSIAGDGRVNVTKLGQTSNTLPWPPAAMTGYVTSINGGTYVASASYEFSSSTLAWYAFDKSTSSVWGGQSGQYSSAGVAPYLYNGANPPKTLDVNGTSFNGDWLQIQMPSAVALSSYSIYYNTSYGCPSLFWILGSRDGVNWILVDSRVQLQPGSSGTITFTLATAPSQSFSFYRIVTGGLTTTGGTVNVLEWTLYGTADTAQTLTVAQPMTLSYGAQTASLTGIQNAGVYAPQDFSSSGLNIPAYVVSNTATPANTVTFSSFGPFAGEGSVYFPGGTGAYVNFGTNSPQLFTGFLSSWWTSPGWTIETWVWYNTLPANTSIFGNMDKTGTNYFSLNVNSGSVYWYYFNGSGVNVPSSGPTVITANSWNHLAVSFDGTTIRVFVNGAAAGSAAVSGTPQSSGNYPMTIDGHTNVFNGYISNLRITRGAALYTTSFTPPTGPLPPVQGVTQAGLPYGTVLLLRNAPAPGRVLTQKFGGANSVASSGTPSVLAFPPAAMTTYAITLNSGYGQGTYVASASTESSTYYAWTAFDKSTSTFWNSGYSYTTNAPYGGTVRTVDVNGTSYAGEWLQIQKPSSIVLANYALLTQSGAVNTPGSWYVLGSRDGTNWFLVDQRSGATWSSGVYNTYQIQSSQAFNYFRIVVNIVSTNTGLSIAEWVLNGTIEGPNVTAEGRLGVGVSAPTRALEVAGDVVCGGTVSAGTGLMFRNALYNGDFRIAQRGTSFVNPSTAYTLDRWYISTYGATGNGTVSQIQSGLANFSNALQLAVTSTTGGNWYITQSLETRDVVRFQNQPVTVSFWYRIPTSFTSQWTAELVWNTSVDIKQQDISVSSTSAGNLVLTNTTAWTYGTFIGFVPPTAQALTVRFLSYNNVVNGAQLQFTGVQLEKGTVATPFEVRPYAIELQLCQRYYWAHQGGTTVKMLVDGTNSANRFYSTSLPVTMRASPTPTATVSSGGPGSNYGASPTMFGWQVSGVATATSIDISAMTANAEL